MGAAISRIEPQNVRLGVGRVFESTIAIVRIRRRAFRSIDPMVAPHCQQENRTRHRVRGIVRKNVHFPVHDGSFTACVTGITSRSPKTHLGFQNTEKSQEARFLTHRQLRHYPVPQSQSRCRMTGRTKDLRVAPTPRGPSGRNSPCQPELDCGRKKWAKNGTQIEVILWNCKRLSSPISWCLDQPRGAAAEWSHLPSQYQ